VTPRRDTAEIVALWGFDKIGRFQPQFIGAVAEGLRDAFYEESERLRRLAEEWFAGLDDDPSENDRWRFEVRAHNVAVPGGSRDIDGRWHDD
jgi:hypothetical protein